jgi:hypothetical protein
VRGRESSDLLAGDKSGEWNDWYAWAVPLADDLYDEYLRELGEEGLTQGAISKLEHSDDVRVSTLRQYLEALGARLELVAVFDDEDRRVPIHLGRDDAA